MIKEINLEQLQEMSKNVNLIDVREDDEVADGMIPDATHMALSKFPELKDKIPNDKKIVFYCRSGKRSLKAAELASHWVDVPLFSLSGGYLGYCENEG